MDGSELRGGYVCDGKRTSWWLKPARLSGGKVRLTSRAGDALGTARLSGERASGELQLAGTAHAFSATAASGKAGLYREAKGGFGKAGYAETGWIVLADGSVRGYIEQDNIKTKPAPRAVGGDQLTTGFIDPSSR